LLAILVVGFAVTAPLAQWRVVAIPQFVPIYDTAIFVLDTLTAVLLYAQFEHLHRRSLLVLACAFVFTPPLVAGHALSIPNAYVPGTAIGGEQTAAWLWVACTPCFPCSSARTP
jgi:two-component system, sensor histidine kinase and response regulator